jgi:sulfotransferase family protein
MSPPIFIVACPRSGTALLRNLLRAHPNITFPDESHFIPGFYKAFGNPRTEQEARDLAAKILGLFWVRNWGLTLTPDDFAGCRSYREIVCLLFEAWARFENKPRWGDKTPQYLTELPAILEIFPEAKIIHIYRDGRDVALSWLQVRFEPRNVYTAAHLWKERVEAAREYAGTLPADTYLELSYESLLTETRTTMETVCHFIEEPFCEQVLTPNILRLEKRVLLNRPTPAHKRRNWTTVMASNVRLWETKMPARDRILFESIAGDLLNSLGYELQGPIRRISAPERLFWRTQHWWRYLIYRIRLPNARQRLITFLRLQLANLRGRLAS